MLPVAQASAAADLCGFVDFSSNIAASAIAKSGQVRRGDACATQIGFDKISRIAATMRSISARDTVSVTQNSPRLVKSAK